MKKIYVGIDISKEKCNLCYRSGLKIVREEEISNEVKALKKAFKAALKALDASMDEVLVCAEYTGRYIYPLTVACQELDIFLWMDDPTRIKNAMGLSLEGLVRNGIGHFLGVVKDIGIAKTEETPYASALH